jgi:hypothetical protein
MAIMFIREVPGRKSKIKYSSFYIKMLNLRYLLLLLFLIILEKVVLCASMEILLTEILLAKGRASSRLKR